MQLFKRKFLDVMTTLVISNEEMNIMKIVKSAKDTGLLIKSIGETNENEAKQRRGGFLSMLLHTLGAGVLGNLLTGKQVQQSNISGQGVMTAGEGTTRVDERAITTRTRYN